MKKKSTNDHQNSTAATKRTPVVRKMTRREFMSLLWIFQNKEMYQKTGEVQFDFSVYDDKALAEKQKFRFVATEEEKELMRDFLDSFPARISLEAYCCTVPKKPISPAALAAVLNKTAGGKAAAGSKSDNSDVPKFMTPDEQLQAALATGTFLKRNPKFDNTASAPCVNAPVLSAEERKNKAWETKRVPQKEACSYDEYPFIINPNEELSSRNIDLDLLLQWFECGKIDIHEMHAITGQKYMRFYSLPPSAFSNVPEQYKDEDSVTTCFMAAKERQGKVMEIANEPEPTEEEIHERYATYLRETLKLIKEDEYKEMTSGGAIEMAIMRIDNDTIYFESADDDEKIYDEIKYDNVDDMKNDLVCLYKSSNLDMDMSFNLFGTTTCINKIIKEHHKKYPNGLNGKFYNTFKEAYFAGVYRK